MANVGEPVREIEVIPRRRMPAPPDRGEPREPSRRKREAAPPEKPTPRRRKREKAPA
jgi:hypothetical protein